MFLVNASRRMGILKLTWVVSAMFHATTMMTTMTNTKTSMMAMALEGDDSDPDSSLTATSKTAIYGDDIENVDLSALGINSLDNLQYSYDISIDNDCMYTLTVRFTHDDQLPVGTNETCFVGVEAPEDGLPYIQGRYNWKRYPVHVREATGIDHISLDFNPCGHPGPGFLVPHWDVHYYRISPQYRAAVMDCILLAETPTCLIDGQDTYQGTAFFNVAQSALNDKGLSNMPPNFAYQLKDAVVNMGMHSWDPNQEPLTPEEWIDPIFLVCSYDSEIVASEPMMPFHYTVGDVDQFYEEDLEYVEQTIPTLPTYYSIKYDASVPQTTIVMKGPSNLCRDEFELASMAGSDQADDSGTFSFAMVTTGTMTSISLLSMMMMTMAGV